MKNEIILFENEDVKLEVNMKDETVWLTQAQISELFEKDRTVITKHINNIFKEQELEEKSNVQKMRLPNSDKPVAYYSLDVIISVGYRVKSKVGTQFRIWANKILKKYLLKGYVANQQRLKYLEKTIKLIDIATRVDEEVGKEQGQQMLKVIRDYTSALDLLDNYDYYEQASFSIGVVTTGLTTKTLYSREVITSLLKSLYIENVGAQICAPTKTILFCIFK